MNTYDKHAVQTAKRFFESRGAEVTITEDQLDPFDLVVKAPQFKLLVEVKHQNIPIDKFGDCFVEYHKYLKATEKLLSDPELKAVYVVNFYDDDSFAIGDILDGTRIQRSCPATTHFGNTKRKEKECWSVKRKYEFNPDFSIRKVYEEAN